MKQNKFICKNHIDEFAIKNFIASNATESICNYCHDNKLKSVLPLEKLHEFITDSVRYFYVNTIDNQYRINEVYTDSSRTTINSYDLLYEEIGLKVENNELRKDLVEVISDAQWIKKLPAEYKENDELYYTWEEFKQIVKHKIRFSFFYIDKVIYDGISIDVSTLLKTIVRLMKKYKLISKLSMETTFFRCRQYELKDDIELSSSICSPPNENVTFSNRMSPAGISMFYAGFEVKTAFKETVDLNNKKKQYFSIGSFKPKFEIDVIDFSKIPPIPSIFNHKRRKNFYSIVFLHRFIEDLSKPISRDGKENIDYVPTQIITEYIRYFFSKSDNLKVGGIVYPSTKVKNSNTCVLFLNHEESIKNLQFIKFNIEHRSIDNISSNFI